MPDSGYPVDPMTAFYAAVTAVENGSVAEIDLDFRFSIEDSEVTMSISVRREIRTYSSSSNVEQKEEE